MRLCVFPWHPGVLQQRAAALETERADFIKLKQQLEAEFNQKRAKFKELYVAKEGEDRLLGGTTLWLRL